MSAYRSSGHFVFRLGALPGRFRFIRLFGCGFAPWIRRSWAEVTALSCEPSTGKTMKQTGFGLFSPRYAIQHFEILSIRCLSCSAIPEK